MTLKRHTIEGLVNLYPVNATLCVNSSALTQKLNGMDFFTDLGRSLPSGDRKKLSL